MVSIRKWRGPTTFLYTNSAVVLYKNVHSKCTQIQKSPEHVFLNAYYHLTSRLTRSKNKFYEPKNAHVKMLTMPVLDQISSYF